MPWQQREHDGVVHDLEARVVAGHQVRRRNTEQLAEDRAQLGQTRQAAVVAAVGTVAVPEIVLTRKREQTVRQIQLFRCRLATGEVQLQLLRLELLVLRGLTLEFGAKFFMAHQPDLGLHRHLGGLSPTRPVGDGKR